MESCKKLCSFPLLKYKGGIAMYDEYVERKCTKCQNKHNNEDKCEIKQYVINGYLYCKCVNCNVTGESQEIRKKL